MSGLLSQRQLKESQTPGSSRYSGYYKGKWYIEGKDRGEKLEADDLAKLSFIQSKQTQSQQEEVFKLQRQEQGLYSQQLASQTATQEKQLGLLSQQVAASEAYSAKYQAQQDEQTRLEQAQAATAKAEADRTTAISSTQARMTAVQGQRMRNRATTRVASRQRGLLSR